MSSLIKILLAVFLPPVAVLVERGVGASLVINIILTILGGVPGMIHALYVVLTDSQSAPSAEPF